jgi:uncharacterized protein
LEIDDTMKHDIGILYSPLDVDLKEAVVTGEFRGYASVFGVRDLVGDVCEPGCFRQTIRNWKARGVLPRLRWRHGQSIGDCTSMVEDDHGLLVTGKLWVGDAAVYDLSVAVKDDAQAMGMSFEYVAVDAPRVGATRQLLEVEILDDITITPRPVNTATVGVEIKSTDAAIRVAEMVLCDKGFGRPAVRRALTSLANGMARALRAR